MAAYVYILHCSDGTYYTGYTTDLNRRVQAHDNGRAAKYTRSRRPVRLCYVEVCSDKRVAMKREWAVKQLNRSQKEQLIRQSTQTFTSTEQLDPTENGLGGGADVRP